MLNLPQSKMDSFDIIQSLSGKNLNEKCRVFKEDRKIKRIVGQDPYIPDQIKESFIHNLESDKPDIVAKAIWDLTQCLLIDLSIISMIEEKHISKLIQMMHANDAFKPNSSEQNKFISLCFHFFTIFIRCDPSKIPYFIESETVQFAIQKIPVDSVSNFILEVLKFSEKLDQNDPLNIFRFLYEFDIRHKLLNAFNQLKNCECQQCQILKLLEILLKYQDFNESELKEFIKYSNHFLNRVCSNDKEKNQYLTIYLNFLVNIKSLVFYSAFRHFETKTDKQGENFFNEDESKYILLEIIWKKIKENNYDVCYACFSFLILAINYQEKGEYVNANYLLNNHIIEHILQFLDNKHYPDNIRLQGAMVIESLITLNLDICITITQTKFLDTIQKFLASIKYFDQYIAIRYVAILMKYNRDVTILNLLQIINPIEKIIDFLNGDHYSLIINLLNRISDDWEVLKNTEIKNDFLQEIFDMMKNEDFIDALCNIKTGDDENASALAKRLLKFIQKCEKADFPG